KSALEVIFTTLHAGGKFEGQNYKTSGGLHGVGASVVNALSTKLVATVKRDGFEYTLEFARGIPQGKLTRGKPVRGTGTQVFFHPDPTIFPKTDFNAETIVERLEVASFLHRGVKIVFCDESQGRTETFHHKEGIVDYVAKLREDRKAKL